MARMRAIGPVFWGLQGAKVGPHLADFDTMGTKTIDVAAGYDPTSAEDALADLVAHLWDERERLDALSAALAGYARAQRTGDEIDLAASDVQVRTNARRLQTLEVLRATEVEMLGGALGLPAGA